MKNNRAFGFTLIELLVVIVIIGMLLTLLSSALLRSRDNARKMQATVEATSLSSAIRAFRTEYGYWPIPENDRKKADVTYVSDNHKVLAYLVSDEAAFNPRGIRFLNLGEFSCLIKGKRVMVGNVWTKQFNTSIINPWDHPYIIKIFNAGDSNQVGTVSDGGATSYY